MSLRRKLLIAKGIGSNHVLECLKEQRVRVAAVEAERHLVQVGGEMLRRDLMPRADNAALQQREGRFDSVGRHHAVNVDASRVIDRFMLASTDPRFNHGLRVAGAVIGHNNFHIFADVLLDVPRQGASLDVLGLEESQLSAALLDPDNDALVLQPPALPSLQVDLPANFYSVAPCVPLEMKLTEAEKTFS